MLTRGLLFFLSFSAIFILLVTTAVSVGAMTLGANGLACGFNYDSGTPPISSDAASWLEHAACNVSTALLTIGTCSGPHSVSSLPRWFGSAPAWRQSGYNIYNTVTLRVSASILYRRNGRRLGNRWVGTINAALKRLKLPPVTPGSTLNVVRLFRLSLPLPFFRRIMFLFSLEHATINLQP